MGDGMRWSALVYGVGMGKAKYSTEALCLYCHALPNDDGNHIGGMQRYPRDGFPSIIQRCKCP